MAGTHKLTLLIDFFLSRSWNISRSHFSLCFLESLDLIKIIIAIEFERDSMMILEDIL